MRKTILALITIIAVAGWLLAVLAGGGPAPAPGDDPLPAIALTSEQLIALFEGSAEQVQENTDALSVLASSSRSQVVSLVERVTSLPDSPLAERLDIALIAAIPPLQQLESGAAATAQAAALDSIAAVGDELAEIASAARQADEAPVDRSFPAALGYVLAAVALVVGTIGLLMPPATRDVAFGAVAGASTLPDARSRAFPRVEHTSGPQSVSAPEGIGVPHLLTREALEKVLRIEQSRAKRYGHKLSVVVLTLNEADQIRASGRSDDLRYAVDAVAELAVTNTRESDIVGELDETRVAILAVETDPESARIVAAKLEKSVELYPFDGEIRATLSTIVVVDAATDLTLGSL